MIYFDNAATTPTFKEVEKLFLDVNENDFGNSSSSHALGRESSRLLENARTQILRLFQLEKQDSLLFTSGATESNNLAIKGIALHYQKRGKRLLTTSVEHASVTNVFRELEKMGFETVVLPVDSKGKLLPETLKNAMDGNTLLVSAMAVNNEVGAINDLTALSSIVHAYPKAFFHVDATQAVGKIKLPFDQTDLFSFSGHKFGSLKGCGGLVYKKSIVFEPVNAGGEQEMGFRSGTVNVPGFVSMALALKMAYDALSSDWEKVSAVNGFLRDALSQREDVSINSPSDALPYVLNFSLKKKKASVVLEALSQRGIYVSSVSACSSKGEPVSYVLEAMGKSEQDARNSLRLSFSARNTVEEAKTFLLAFDEIMKEVHDR